jgi:FtsP/CotA-like multicopper oxidase with cupredoxin domain
MTMSARISRRALLAGLAALPALPALTALTLVGCEVDRTTAAPLSTVDTLDFSNRLRIPALAESTVDHDGVRVFHLSASEGSAEFLPGVSTPTWSYSDGRYSAGFLGPTLRVTRGEQVRMIVKNRLPEITTVHWHGMHLPARYDGGRISPSRAVSCGSRSGRLISRRPPSGITRTRTVRPRAR